MYGVYALVLVLLGQRKSIKIEALFPRFFFFTTNLHKTDRKWHAEVHKAAKTRNYQQLIDTYKNKN